MLIGGPNKCLLFRHPFEAPPASQQLAPTPSAAAAVAAAPVSNSSAVNSAAASPAGALTPGLPRKPVGAVVAPALATPLAASSSTFPLGAAAPGMLHASPSANELWQVERAFSVTGATRSRALGAASALGVAASAPVPRAPSLAALPDDAASFPAGSIGCRTAAFGLSVETLVQLLMGGGGNAFARGAVLRSGVVTLLVQAVVPQSTRPRAPTASAANANASFDGDDEDDEEGSPTPQSGGAAANFPPTPTWDGQRQTDGDAPAPPAFVVVAVHGELRGGNAMLKALALFAAALGRSESYFAAELAALADVVLAASPTTAWGQTLPPHNRPIVKELTAVSDYVRGVARGHTETAPALRVAHTLMIPLWDHKRNVVHARRLRAVGGSRGAHHGRRFVNAFFERRQHSEDRMRVHFSNAEVFFFEDTLNALPLTDIVPLRDAFDALAAYVKQRRAHTLHGLCLALQHVVRRRRSDAWPRAASGMGGMAPSASSGAFFKGGGARGASVDDLALLGSPSARPPARERSGSTDEIFHRAASGSAQDADPQSPATAVTEAERQLVVAAAVADAAWTAVRCFVDSGALVVTKAQRVAFNHLPLCRAEPAVLAALRLSSNAGYDDEAAGHAPLSRRDFSASSDISTVVVTPPSRPETEPRATCPWGSPRLCYFCAAEHRAVAANMGLHDPVDAYPYYTAATGAVPPAADGVAATTARVDAWLAGHTPSVLDERYATVRDAWAALLPTGAIAIISAGTVARLLRRLLAFIVGAGSCADMTELYDATLGWVAELLGGSGSYDDCQGAGGPSAELGSGGGFRGKRGVELASSAFLHSVLAAFGECLVVIYAPQH
jgi:hypothetical protein